MPLLVADRLTDQAIAHQIGLCRWTLSSWKTPPDVVAATQHLVDDDAAELRRATARRCRV